MSPRRRFVVSIGIILLVLSGTTVLWYQIHYVAPYAPPPAQVLPSPNGYDTLQKALKLRFPKDISHLRWDYQFFSKRHSLAERQELLAENKECLRKTREVLTQEYLIPKAELADLDNLTSWVYGGHLDLLIYVARTHADSGNLAEAMQYALDTVEIGMLMPRGGELSVKQLGYHYETQGRIAVWQLTNRIDAKTARLVARRLEEIEERRWPLLENWHEDLRLHNLTPALSHFKDGPTVVWESTEYASANPNSLAENAAALWNRAKAVFYGPKALSDSLAEHVQRAQERSKSPWNPQPQELSNRDSSEDYLSSYQYAYLETDEFFHRTESVLLRTYLALRAYWLEHGSYPQSLDSLVSEGYLKAMSIDPFSPNFSPLRYQPDGTLWSIGPDAKDDNGQAIEVKNGHDTEKHIPGDIVPGISITAHSFPDEND